LHQEVSYPKQSGRTLNTHSPVYSKKIRQSFYYS